MALMLALIVSLSFMVSACTKPPRRSEGETLLWKLARLQASEGAERLFEAGFLDVWQAALDVLAQKRIPIAVVDLQRGLIISESVELSPEELARLSTASEGLTRHGGRYVLQLKFIALSEEQTQLEAALLLIAHLPMSLNPLGGVPVRSSGILEAEIFDAIDAKLYQRIANER